jgi:hypothetical protein
LKQGQDLLKNIVVDAYFRASETPPETPFQRLVYSAIQSTSGETLETISRRLSGNGLEMMLEEAKFFLNSLLQEGFVYARRVDRTKYLLNRCLAASRQRHRRRCRACGGILIPLYVVLVKKLTHTREKVGIYCMKCKQQHLERGSLIS